MGGTLYTSWKDSFGTSHIDEPVALYENGKIYSATDGFFGTTSKGVLIGEYENGKVYSVGTGTLNYGKRLHLVAIYEGGNIYSVSNNVSGGINKSLSVGACSYGKVYSHSHKIMGDSDSCGLYNGDAEGAAASAAIVLFKLNSNVSAHTPNVGDSGKSKEYSNYQANQSSGGGFGAIGGFLFFFILAALSLFIYRYGDMAVYIVIPMVILGISLIVKAIKKRSVKMYLRPMGIGIGAVVWFIYGFLAYGINLDTNSDAFLILCLLIFMAIFGIDFKNE